MKEYRKRYEIRYPGRRREYHKLHTRKTRLRVLKHYSGENPSCACCGESEVKFLTLDHTNNDGYKTRSNGKRAAGSELCRWIIKNQFPPIFQVLCFNCNCAKGFYEVCPHKQGDEKW